MATGRTGGTICEPGLVSECVWPYGATENMVWEGVNTTVALTPGVAATVSIKPLKDSDYCCWGDRNIDAILLHPNRTEVDYRLHNAIDGQVLPLDGLFSQYGEVFFKVENMNKTLNLSLDLGLM